MGLDIGLGTDNYEVLYEGDKGAQLVDENKHNLSRDFCNLMMRRHDCQGEPEIEQLGRIAGVDISPLYEMENHPTEDEVEWRMDLAADEGEILSREQMLERLEAERNLLNGNIPKVRQTVDELIKRLSTIDNLTELLNFEPDSPFAHHDEYFSDFNIDKGDGYIDNNVGQDLRNFQRFLEHAENESAKRVFFYYG